MSKVVDLEPVSGIGYSLLTSESVTEGHPDKLCDNISDTLLDAYMREDPHSRVAIETVVSRNTVFLSGEVASDATPDTEKIVREAIVEVGYDNEEKGFDGNTCLILKNIVSQSPDIAMGVQGERLCECSRSRSVQKMRD